MEYPDEKQVASAKVTIDNMATLELSTSSTFFRTILKLGKEQKEKEVVEFKARGDALFHDVYNKLIGK